MYDCTLRYADLWDNEYRCSSAGDKHEKIRLLVVSGLKSAVYKSLKVKTGSILKMSGIHAQVRHSSGDFIYTLVGKELKSGQKSDDVQESVRMSSSRDRDSWFSLLLFLLPACSQPNLEV